MTWSLPSPVWGALLLTSAMATMVSGQSSAGLAGTVRDSAGTAVPRAQLSLSGARAFTDSIGRFTFAGLPSGVATLSVRRIGFEPIDAQLELVAGRMDSLDVVLITVPGLLPEVTTQADALERLRLATFYRHRAVGNGSFFNRKELEAQNVLRLSDVLRRVPGIRLTPDRNGRIQLRMTRSTCTPDYWIDAQRAPFLNVDDLPLHDIEAIEVYRGASGIPPEFNNRLGNPGCGAIVIWTRLPG